MDSSSNQFRQMERRKVDENCVPQNGREGFSLNDRSKATCSAMRSRILISILAMLAAQLVPLARRDCLFVDASLIHIYHRYKPKMGAEETLNSSSSSPVGDQFDDPDHGATLSPSEIEFRSPMKRIMELISHHPPLIVVSSDSPQQESSQAQQEPASSLKNAGENSMISLVQSPVAGQQSKTTNQQINLMSDPVSGGSTIDGNGQQWTLVAPSQMIQQQSQPHHQAILTGQQQQLIQTTVPFEQYYLAPGQMNDQQQQLAVLPASMGLGPAASIYQQVPYGAQASQQQQQLNQLQLASSEERTQPIFLSSYVPEVPLQAINNQGFPGLPILTQQTGVQQQQDAPHSIQQIQQSQQQPAKKEEEKSKPLAEDKPNLPKEEEDETSDGGVRVDSNYDPDEEEGGKIKRSNQGGGPGEDMEEPSSGSLSYEDKYDSDKGEPRSSGSQNYKVDPLVPNGLVNVGLNDDCLQCICRASSGCDQLQRCITRGAEERYCGPFELTEEYWNKAGSVGDSANNFSSYEDCANDVDCAVETVTNYMKKYHRDCDGDGNITCMDYARLHRLRPDECSDTDKLKSDYDAYWAKFQQCAEGYNRTRNGEDEDI